MNNNKVLIVSLLVGVLIGAWVILVYGYSHFEASTIGLISFSLAYMLLRFNRIDRKLDALVSQEVDNG